MKKKTKIKLKKLNKKIRRKLKKKGNRKINNKETKNINKKNKIDKEIKKNNEEKYELIVEKEINKKVNKKGEETNKAKKKIINILKEGIFIFLIFLLIFVMYSKYAKKEPIIKVLGNAFLIVATGSMKPEIQPGELIIIKEKVNYEKGDIVTYIDKDEFIITHRIVEKNENTFVAKGDSNNIKDESCDIERIQGKVVFHSKLLGFFILYLLKPICFLYGIYIILIEVLKQKEKGEKENKKEEIQPAKI